jgi:hypothetical protein
MTKDKHMIRSLLLTAVVAAAGCGAVVDAPVATQGKSLHWSALPPVGGCERAQPSRVHVTVHAIDGVDDLYLVQQSGGAVCIDSAAGVRAMLARTVDDPRMNAESNPMPGTVDDTSSNPMPGTVDNTASNPMPGENSGKK